MKIKVMKNNKKTSPIKTTKKVVKIGHDHPNHRVHLKQLARVKGQVEGIEKMINEERYCVDIINQLKAVSAGLKVVESAIFDSHLQNCVNAALTSKNAAEIQKKMAEINKLVYGSKSKR